MGYNNANPAGGLNTSRIVDGMLRAARLDRAFFSLVEKDTSYSQDALAVVVLVSIISALGAFVGALFAGNVLQAIGTLIWTAIRGIGGFYLLVYVVQYIGTHYFKGQGDVGEVQRCLGFAYAPQVLGILAIIPCVGWLGAFVGSIWSAVASWFAVKESLDQDDTNAILTVVVSFVVLIIVWAVIGALLAALGVIGRAL